MQQENNSLNKIRATLNNQFLPNYVRPMHLLRNSSKKDFFFKSDLRPKFYSSNRNKEKKVDTKIIYQ